MKISVFQKSGKPAGYITYGEIPIKFYSGAPVLQLLMLIGKVVS